MGDIRELESELEELNSELDAAGKDRIRRFSERYEQLQDLISSIGGKELPHKQAVRNASKTIAAEIQADVESGDLGEKELELLDPVFAKLKYADKEGAQEALKSARPRTRLAERHDDALSRYRRAYRSEERKLEELGEKIREREATMERLRELLEDDAEERLRRFQESVEAYNSSLTTRLEEFLERDCSEVLSLVLDASFFPETRPPKPRDPEAAEELTGLDDPTVFDLLEAEGYSEGKLRHVFDEPDRIRELLEGCKVWLREVSRLPETDFLKMEVEDPSMALHRADAVERFLRRIDGPIEELGSVRRAAQRADDEMLEARELSGSLGAEPGEAEEVLEEELEELRREKGRTEELLAELRNPEEFRIS